MNTHCMVDQVAMDGVAVLYLIEERFRLEDVIMTLRRLKFSPF